MNYNYKLIAMSIITIQVGQCGNQIGQAFFDQLVENIVHSTDSTSGQAGASSSLCSPYIREKVISTYFERVKGESDSLKLEAKAILLDMEPKVVQKCLNSRS